MKTLTMGADNINMTAQVEAGISLLSLATPATTAPTIPPTSNNVAISALSAAPIDAVKK